MIEHRVLHCTQFQKNKLFYEIQYRKRDCHVIFFMSSERSFDLSVSFVFLSTHHFLNPDYTFLLHFLYELFLLRITKSVSFSMLERWKRKTWEYFYRAYVNIVVIFIELLFANRQDKATLNLNRQSSFIASSGYYQKSDVPTKVNCFLLSNNDDLLSTFNLRVKE